MGNIEIKLALVILIIVIGTAIGVCFGVNQKLKWGGVIGSLIIAATIIIALIVNCWLFY